MRLQECCICTIIVGTDEQTKRRADKLMQVGCLGGLAALFFAKGSRVTEGYGSFSKDSATVPLLRLLR